MNQLNSIILEGNLVRQAELSEPAKGFKVCKFPMAVNRFGKNMNGDSFEEVSFFDVEAYGKMAEICEKNGTKGRGIRVVGRLKQNRWKDTEGKSLSKVFIVAEHVEYRPNYPKTEEQSLDENDKLGENDSGSSRNNSKTEEKDSAEKETATEEIAEEENAVF